MCYYRYGDLRFKATEKAYEMIITFHYLDPQKAPSIGTVAIDLSTIKAELEKEFELKYHERLNNLIKGFSNVPKQVVIKSGEIRDTIFQASQYEYWYCLGGKGKIIIKNDKGDQECFLQPNTSIPILKGKMYSFKNNYTEPLELIVLNQ